MKIQLANYKYNQNFKSLITKGEEKFTPEQEIIYERLKQPLFEPQKHLISHFESNGYDIEIKPIRNFLNVSANPKQEKSKELDSHHIGLYSINDNIEENLVERCREIKTEIKKSWFSEKVLYWIGLAALVILSIRGCSTGIKEFKTACESVNKIKIEPINSLKKTSKAALQFNNLIK